MKHISSLQQAIDFSDHIFVSATVILMAAILAEFASTSWFACM